MRKTGLELIFFGLAMAGIGAMIVFGTKGAANPTPYVRTNASAWRVLRWVAFAIAAVGLMLLVLDAVVTG